MGDHARIDKNMQDAATSSAVPPQHACRDKVHEQKKGFQGFSSAAPRLHTHDTRHSRFTMVKRLGSCKKYVEMSHHHRWRDAMHCVLCFQGIIAKPTNHHYRSIMCACGRTSVIFRRLVIVVVFPALKDQELRRVIASDLLPGISHLVEDGVVHSEI